MAIQTLPSVKAHASDTVDALFKLVTDQGDSDYIGERVSQLQHSLQAATLAQKACANDEIVLGALLHDIGRFIPAAEKMPAMMAADGTYVGRASHEVLGRHYLRQLGFSEKICQLGGAHVVAKRYLTAIDKGYYDGLSPSSKTTLNFQGGTFTEELVREAQKDPLLQAKLAVRRWDDQAKDSSMKTSPLFSYNNMATNALLKSTSQIELHGRTYSLPTKTSVVVCVDGFGPAYLEQGIEDGILPSLEKMVKHGFHATAKSCMPSFTNPNNVSIITGQPLAVHGISGNFFLDCKTGKKHIITDDSLLKGSTTLELMSKRGIRVAAVTAKDKPRRILAHGLQGAICFLSQDASTATA